MNQRIFVLWSSMSLGFLGAATSCTITTTSGTDAGTGGALTGTGGSSATGGSATGGSATGGSVGTGGTTTDAAADVAVTTDAGSDPCTAADPGNDDRDHATAYPLNADYHACLQTPQDVDFYEFTTPATPVGGGVVIVNLIDVGTNGGVDSTSFATSDNGTIEENFADDGTNVYYWFGVVPGTRYRINVASFAQNAMPNPYTLRVTFQGVDDTNEPNDTRATAKTIALATPVHGFMFAGYSSSVAPTDMAWQDWFKVTLAAGSATITLSNVPSTATGSFTVYDSTGATVAGGASGSNDGATVTAMRTITAAGDYFIDLSPFLNVAVKGDGPTPPAHTTQAYTLTVTQP